MRIPTGADPAVQQALAQLWQEIDRLRQGDINMKGRRIVNAATGVQGADYVTRSQLREYVQSQQFAQDVQIVIPSGGGGGGGSSAGHQLLSSTHIDTSPAAPTRGDLIVANSTPLWARLATGTAESALFTNGTDPAWRKMSSCRVYNSADLTIPDVTLTTLTFNSERFDTDTMHSTVSNTGRITFTTAGKYIAGVHLVWKEFAGTALGTFIRLNGTTVIAGIQFDSPADGTNGAVQSLATLYDFAANDYIEARVIQRSGGDLNITASGNQSPEFWAHRLS